jgi:hypothetical protein
MSRLEDPQADIARKLDQAVGNSYHEDAADPKGRRRNAVVKGIAAAAGAAAVTVSVIYAIETHQFAPGVHRPPPKPVMVQILPAKPPP